MPDHPVEPVVLDATVCSNFASSDSVGYLVGVLDRPGITPAVRDELTRGRSEGYDFLDAVLERIGRDIRVLEPTGREPGAAPELRDRLDAGETQSLLGAIERGGTLATDDLAARRLAADRGVPVTGSIGLLVPGVRRGTIDAATANEWLSTWNEKRGYFAPVDRVEEIL